MLRTVFVFALVGGLFAPTDMALAQDAQLVEVAAVRFESVDVSRPLIATLEAVMRTSVAAEVDGRIASRSFDDGETIKANAELVSLDTALMQADLAAADAAVAAARAELNRAQVNVNRAMREYKRQQELFEKQVSPEKELLDAQSEYELADAELVTRQASVTQREALKNRIATEIKKAKVFAPFDGRVAKRYVEVGQWVKQGDVVADIVQLDPLYVVAAVPELLAGQIKTGDVGSVTLDALPGKTIDAPIAQIMPEADMGSRMVRVRLTLENKSGQLKPGFLARVVFKRPSGDSLIVPKNAVVTGAQGTHVVVSRGNVAAIVPITVVKTNMNDAVVNGELKAGDLVVTRGNEMLFPGAALQFTPPSTEPANAEQPAETGGTQP